VGDKGVREFRWGQAKRPLYMTSFAGILFVGTLSVLLGVGAGVDWVSLGSEIPPGSWEVPIVFTQLPARQSAAVAAPIASAFELVGEGGRLVFWAGRGKPQILTKDFYSAADPDVAFDGKRIAFAAKPTRESLWEIFEVTLDGSLPRRVIRMPANCRLPSYQSQLFTLDAPAPWQQITFVSDAPQVFTEAGVGQCWELYSCTLDGKEVSRLTFALSYCLDPWMIPDGRVLFTTWFRRQFFHGREGVVHLMGINLDGTDYALFGDLSSKRFKRMPCYTESGLVVFVEGDRLHEYGSGQLGAISYRRPLRSYRPLTTEAEGLFHSPSPLPDGTILVAHRPPGGSSWGIYRFDPHSGRKTVVFDDPHYDELQPRALVPRQLPDGRSSVVHPEKKTGKLYCLTVNISDLPREFWPVKENLRLRVLEGIPYRDPKEATFWGCGKLGDSEGSFSLGPMVARRFLGEFQIADDGSFQVEVPADIPLELQLVDTRGVSLRSCGWIWVRPNENRGCIGCHEDGELTPPNDFAQALGKPAVSLTLPPERRRMTEFYEHVWPIVRAKCLSCHGPEGHSPRLVSRVGWTEHPPGSEQDRQFAWEAFGNLVAGIRNNAPMDGRFVRPGESRLSPVIWHLVGENLARPWDGQVGSIPVKPISPEHGVTLTKEEIRTFVEWIDLGAFCRR